MNARAAKRGAVDALVGMTAYSLRLILFFQYPGFLRRCETAIIRILRILSGSILYKIPKGNLLISRLLKSPSRTGHV